MTNQVSPTIYAKLLLMALFWGGTFIAGRLLAGEVGPFAAAFLRFAVAGLVLLQITLRRHRCLPMVPGKNWPAVLLLGLSGVFAYNVFFFKGLELVEAGRAAVIIANNPIAIALFAALLFGERLTAGKLFGICLSVAGAVVVITRGEPGLLLQGGIGHGELLILGCVLSWVTYSLAGRFALRSLSPLVAVTWSALVGALLLFPAALYEGLLDHIGDYSARAWGCLLYLALCGTVISFVWYYQGIRAIGSTRAGQFINFVPISAVLLSAWWLDEPLTGSLLFGVILVSSGVYLTNRRSLAGSGGRT